VVDVGVVVTTADPGGAGVTTAAGGGGVVLVVLEYETQPEAHITAASTTKNFIASFLSFEQAVAMVGNEAWPRRFRLGPVFDS
jgi:hypothetical protein